MRDVDHRGIERAIAGLISARRSDSTVENTSLKFAVIDQVSHRLLRRQNPRDFVLDESLWLFARC